LPLSTFILRSTWSLNLTSKGSSHLTNSMRLLYSSIYHMSTRAERNA
jgi:hypothetical protein